MDLARAGGNSGMTHTINNPLDWVPQVPFALQGLSDLTDNPIGPYLRAKHPVLSASLSFVGGAVRLLKTGISSVANKIPEWRSHLSRNIDRKYLTTVPGTVSGAGSLNYVPCGELRSTRIEPNLEGIVPNWRSDPLAQHHLATYGKLL